MRLLNLIRVTSHNLIRRARRAARLGGSGTAVLVALAGCAGDGFDIDGRGGDVASEKSTVDTDGDGYSEYTGDCDETNVNVNPGESEICDSVDNDCDELIDDADPNRVGTQWLWDGDDDGYGEELSDGTANDEYACDMTEAYAQLVENVGGDTAALANYIVGVYDSEGNLLLDCDDEDASINPAASEVCDGVDNDCDDSTDEDATDMIAVYVDADGDTFGDETDASGTTACAVSAGWSASADDCNDAEAAINPDAIEVCDASDVDEDCSGDADDDDASATGQTAWYTDSDDDEYGTGTASIMACDDASGRAAVDGDCDDADSMVWGATTWYFDYDGDGYGRSSVTVSSCEQPTDFIATNSDCDDTDAAVNPGASEVSDGADNNCDGAIDENVECTDQYLVFSEGGEVTGVNVDAPGTTLDGEWTDGSVSGVSYSSTSLGGDVWMAEFITTSLCLEGADQALLDITFADGSSGCVLEGSAMGSLYALQDGSDLTVADWDVDEDGDTIADYCLLSVSE